jgi:hypothetical protein
MLMAVAAVALLAAPAPAAARTAHSGVHMKAKFARTYVQHRPTVRPQVYIPANRGVAAANAFQHYDDIFVLDP